eukprot:801436-Rhodomonas_salina.1
MAADFRGRLQHPFGCYYCSLKEIGVGISSEGLGVWGMRSLGLHLKAWGLGTYIGSRGWGLGLGSGV